MSVTSSDETSEIRFFIHWDITKICLLISGFVGEIRSINQMFSTVKGK